MKDQLTHNQLYKIEETLKDFKVLIFRYREVKDDVNLLKMFLSRNRNPIWDITNLNYFRTGLISETARNLPKNQLVDDHFIQRSRAMSFIFEALDNNEMMGIEEFINIVKKYCSTVKITKDEHIKITQMTKRNPDYLNYENYIACGIKILGLSEFILKNY